MKALIPSDFTEATEPFSLFESWFDEAKTSEPNDPEAMALATAGPDGLPNVRMVLLKAATPDGFVFYSNAQSAKGCELQANMQAAAVLHWKSLRRQIRFRGPVENVTGAEADAYFASRAPKSRLGACASQQSRPLDSRAMLEAEVERLSAVYADGVIPRPPHWIGYRIKPLAIEFWSDGAFRLHDRIQFYRERLDAPWTKTRLYP